MIRLIWRGLLCGVLGVLAAIAITEIVRTQFSWAQLKANVRVFVEAVTSGDLMLTLTALASPPVILAMFVVCCAVGALLARLIGPPKN
jgi:hypothetical protein